MKLKKEGNQSNTGNDSLLFDMTFGMMARFVIYSSVIIVPVADDGVIPLLLNKLGLLRFISCDCLIHYYFCSRLKQDKPKLSTDLLFQLASPLNNSIYSPIIIIITEKLVVDILVCMVRQCCQ